MQTHSKMLKSSKHRIPAQHTPPKESKNCSRRAAYIRIKLANEQNEVQHVNNPKNPSRLVWPSRVTTEFLVKLVLLLAFSNL